LGYRLFWTPHFPPYLWLPPILIRITDILNKILFNIIVLNHNMKCLENMQVCVCLYIYMCVRVCISIIMFIYLFFLVVMIFFLQNISDLSLCICLYITIITFILTNQLE